MTEPDKPNDKAKAFRYEAAKAGDKTPRYFRDRKVFAKDVFAAIDSNLDALSPTEKPTERNVNLALYYLLEAVDKISRDIGLLHNRLENLEREVGGIQSRRSR